VDARRTPGWILGNHAEDELTQFLADASSSCMFAMPEEPGPAHLEPRAMPAHDSFGLNEDKRRSPFRPDTTQGNSEESISARKSWTWVTLRENRQLLTQCKVFQK